MHLNWIKCFICCAQIGGLPLPGPEAAQYHKENSLLHQCLLKAQKKEKKQKQQIKEAKEACQWLATWSKKTKKKEKKTLPPVPLFQKDKLL